MLALSKDCWKNPSLGVGLYLLCQLYLEGYWMKEIQFLKQTINEAVDSKSKEDREPGCPKGLPCQIHSAYLAILPTAIALF